MGGKQLIGPRTARFANDGFRQVVGVNLEGAFLAFKGAARHMIERGGRVF